MEDLEGQDFILFTIPCFLSLIMYANKASVTILLTHRKVGIKLLASDPYFRLLNAFRLLKCK